MKSLSFACLIGVILLIFYIFVLGAFYSKNPNQEFPVLRNRIGTILWHSGDNFNKNPGHEDHIYCFYPSSQASYPNRGGEYIIKRVQSFGDCQGWHGSVIFNEGWWVSEREKIWWNEDQYQKQG